MGLVLTFIFSVVSTAYNPLIKKQALKVYENRIAIGLIFAFEYLVKLFVMFLMMTMNAYVLLAIALGVTTGFMIFEVYGKQIESKIQLFGKK